MAGQLAIGVVGHVDHGKTTLVKALTGTETDRLAEERERGLSIVLGFAFRKTEQGLIDFIDAPGHADFVRTMISGATGIDAALIVVAANEGIMPQTREHVRIVSLLGMERTVVALTKSDLVSADELLTAEAKIRAYLSDMGFAEGAVVPVCAPTGEGMDELLTALGDLFQNRIRPTDRGRFYLPIDRVFSMHGHGTVVTGTLRGGALTLGDEGEIAGTGIIARLRRLEVHGHEVCRADPGQRVAANLRIDGGIKPLRGQALASPGWLTPSEWWSAALRMADDAATNLRNGKPVRLLFGTKEVIATLRLLDRDEIAPGDAATVQFHLREPDAAWGREHFVIRTLSPVETVGGGRFLDTQASRIKRYDDQALAIMEAGSGEDAGIAIPAFVEQMGSCGVLVMTLAQKFSVSESFVRESAAKAGALVGDDLVIGVRSGKSMREKLTGLLAAYHTDHPTRFGMALLELGEKLDVSMKALDLVVAALRETGEVVEHSQRIGLSEFHPLNGLSDSEKVRIDYLEARLRQTLLMPPTMEEISTGDKRDVARAELLIEIGRVVPLYDFKRKNLFLFHVKDIENAVESLREAWPSPDQFRLGEAREHLGVTRKFLQPVLEYLDKQKITRRREDFREFL